MLAANSHGARPSSASSSAPGAAMSAGASGGRGLDLGHVDVDHDIGTGTGRTARRRTRRHAGRGRDHRQQGGNGSGQDQRVLQPGRRALARGAAGGQAGGEQVAAGRRLPVQHLAGNEQARHGAAPSGARRSASKRTPPAVLIASSIGRGAASRSGSALMKPASTSGSFSCAGDSNSCSRPIFTPCRCSRLFRCVDRLRVPRGRRVSARTCSQRVLRQQVQRQRRLALRGDRVAQAGRERVDQAALDAGGGDDELALLPMRDAVRRRPR